MKKLVLLEKNKNELFFYKIFYIKSFSLNSDYDSNISNLFYKL